MPMTVTDVPRLRKIHLSPRLSLMTQQPKSRTQVTDDTGMTVAANVRRVRELRGWSTYELSRKLKQAGRPIAPSALAKLERAERRVDAGDLTALAVVLKVSPSALLLPLHDGADVSVGVTGGGTVPADEAWDWMDGKRPLHLPEKDVSTADLEYRLASRPAGRRDAFGVVLRPRGARGAEQVVKIREAYSVLAGLGLDLRELQRLSVDEFEQLMGERDDG